MISRNIILSSLFAGLTLGANCVADEQACPPIVETESPYLHEIWYGYENPEMIPDHLKYRVFETMYNEHLTELVQQLTPDDHAILMHVKEDSSYWRDIEGERYSVKFAELCEKSPEMDPVSVATAYERIALESKNRMSAHMKDAIETLSPTGRQAVLDHIKYEITPERQYPKTDSVTLAVDDPDSFLSNFSVMCYVSINGELPPEIKKVMECHQKQVSQSPNQKDQPAVGFSHRIEN